MSKKSISKVLCSYNNNEINDNGERLLNVRELTSLEKVPKFCIQGV